MLYTFTVTESELNKISDYLDRKWLQDLRPNQYIWGIQRSLIDDRVLVTVDCDDKTATIIGLMI